MRRMTWSLRGVLYAAVLCSCKESMHPPAESVENPEPAPQAQPAKAEKPVETATKPAEQSAEKERTKDGYEVVRANPHEGEGPAADVQVKAPEGWKVASPPDSPDPHAGKFTLAEALKGLPAQGKLSATIRTSLGSLECQLFDDKAPTTVANFVGLARGVRKFWSGKDHAWVARPYYDGTTFHRVIPEFMIQGGDWAGDGSGNMYFTIPDELHPTLKHDRGGLLCMANRGPNTNEAQFFITEAAAPHLDTSYTIFGECSPVDLVKRIARVPQNPHSNKPLTPVTIEHVIIQRGGKAGAAPAAAKPATTAPAATSAVPAGKAVQVDPPKQPTAQ